jgi:ABC-type transport system involved in multi-copper enzyme maturation permease subunit
VVLTAALFAILFVTVILLAFRTVRELGLTGIGTASATLVNLGVLLPSLMGLVLGAGSLVGAREQGMLSMMAAQPLRRGSLASGAFAGLTGAIWTTLGAGFGVSLVIVSGVAKANDVPALLALVGATLGVAAASVAVGVAISAIVTSRAQAIAGAVGAWILFALGVDLALAAVAPSVQLGPGWLLTAVLLNPMEAGRVLALLGTNMQGTALGPFGVYVVNAFGRYGTVLLLVGALVAWTLGPLILARWALGRRDL